MRDWGFLTALLDKVQSHSTVIGKIWMNVLFIFRILVLGAAAESVWRDEHSNLVCNTLQPGCENVCYDWQFPISHIRLWVMQILLVSTPTLVYLVYAVQVFHQENKPRQKIQSLGEGHMLKDHKYTDESGHVKIKVKLESYLTQLFFKIILEIAFIIGQYYLYDFIMIAKFTCFQAPCPYTVECFISRPTEKTIFIIFMLVLACVSLLLNVIEIFYVLCTRLRCQSGNKQAHNITSAKNPASLPSSPGSHGWALRMQNMLFESCQDLSEGLDGVEDERHLLTDH